MLGNIKIPTSGPKPRSAAAIRMEKSRAVSKARFERASKAAEKIREQFKDMFPDHNKFGAKRSPQLEEIVLQGIRQGNTLAVSAYAANVSRETVINWINKSESTRDLATGLCTDDFADRYRAAEEAGTDIIEQEAIRRAVDGVDRPVYQQGTLVGHTTEYSDSLMGLMLRGRRPSRFNTERHEHSGPNGKAIPLSMEIEFVKSESEK